MISKIEGKKVFLENVRFLRFPSFASFEIFCSESSLNKVRIPKHHRYSKRVCFEMAKKVSFLWEKKTHGVEFAFASFSSNFPSGFFGYRSEGKCIVFGLVDDKIELVIKSYLKNDVRFENELNSYRDSKLQNFIMPKLVHQVVSDKYDGLLFEPHEEAGNYWLEPKELELILKELQDMSLVHGDLAFWNLDKTRTGEIRIWDFEHAETKLSSNFDRETYVKSLAYHAPLYKVILFCILKLPSLVLKSLMRDVPSTSSSSNEEMIRIENGISIYRRIFLYLLWKIYL